MIALHVQLLDRRVHVVREIQIPGRRAASLVLVGRNVRAEALQRAQTIARVRFHRALALDHLHAHVVILGARVAEVADATPVELVAAARRRGIAPVAPDGFTYGETEGQLVGACRRSTNW